MQKRESERGTAVLEFALIIPVFLTLVLGMIDFGLVLSDNQALHEGTRTVARESVVGEFGSNASCAMSTLSAMPNNDTLSLICAVKDAVGGDPADVRVKIDYNNYAEGNKLVLCSMAPAESLTGFIENFLTDSTNKARFQMRIENTDSVSLVAVEEAAFAGEDWTWCSII